jgi:tetratricopeptide (TPR) repeat protein
MKSNLLSMAILWALSLWSLEGVSQSAYEQGWDAFNKNDRVEAFKQFTEATKDPSTAENAWLSRALVNYSDSRDGDAHANFLNFLNTSKNPYPAAYALWSTSLGFGSGKLSKLDLVAIKKMLLDPNCNGTMRAMINQRMGEHLEASKLWKKAWLEYDKIGSVTNWQVVGTFDNTSGSGFNKSYGPLEHPEADAEFKNKVEAKVKWYTVPQEKKNRWFDFDLYFNYGNSIVYAQTFVKSEKAQKAFLYTGVSGSIKVWVNDKLVLQEQEERNNDLDTYVNSIELNKGYNRILVQIGESEANAANFMVRICDDNANPIAGLTSVAEYQEYDKAEAYTVEKKTVFAEEFFEAAIKEDPKNLLDHLLLASTYLRNDKKYESRKTMKAATALAPTSTLVSVFAIQAFAKDNNVTDLTRERDKLKKNDPKSIFVMTMLLNEADEREDYDEVETILKDIENVHGSSKFVELQKIALLGQREKVEEAMDAVNDYYKKYPQDEDAVLLKFNIQQAVLQSNTAGMDILMKYLKKTYNENIENELINTYFNAGMAGSGLALLNKRLENYPYSVGVLGDLSDIYTSMQNYTYAEKYAKMALEFAPYESYYSEKLGSLAEQQKKNTEAERYYEDAIYYDPTSYDAREQLRKLQDKEELFDKFQKVDAEAIYKASPPASDYPDDNSHFLLYDNQRLVYPEGASEEKVEMLVKVHNQAGIDRWKEYVISKGGSQRLIIDKTEVFKINGSVTEAERNYNQVVFTDLEVGDAIHISYRLRNYNYGKLSKHFWDQFSFQYGIPAQTTRYSMLVPKGYNFKYEVMNGDIKPTITDVEDMTMYVWEATNQKSLKYETAMPPLVDIAPTLDISTLPDWKFVANWYNDLSSTHAKQDFEIKETVAELFKDAPAKMTELEKAKMIYDHVVQNVSYSQVPFRQGPIIPQRASRTLRTKLGDCKDVSTLFVAMCKEVGIKANLVLVDTKDNGRKHLNLPTIAFNHCIARAVCDGKPYYVELTNQKLSFLSLPDMDVNARVLLIPNDVDSTYEGLTTLAPKNRPANGLERITELNIEGSDLVVSRKTIRSGDMASDTRGSYADIGKEEQEKNITSAIASGHTNQVKLLSLTFGNLKGREDTIHYNYKYKISNEVNDVVGMKIFKMPWSDKLNSLDFTALETRKFPFVMFREFGAESEKEVMTLNIPAGKALAEMPKNVKYSCSVADYSMTYTKQGNKLVATREFKLKKEYAEVKEYQEFKDFFSKVMEADTKQIALK